MSTLQIIGKEYYLKDIFGVGFKFFIPRWRDPEKWQQIHEATADAMARLEKALKLEIAALNI